MVPTGSPRRQVDPHIAAWLHPRPFTESRMRIPAMALAALLLAFPAHAQTAPNFADFPPKGSWNGRNAAPKLVSPDLKMFRTRIRDGAMGEPNFGGHYRLATWGCGASCLMGAVIDLNSGAVTSIPFSVCCNQAYGMGFEPILVRQGSRLIAFQGLRDEDGPMGQHWYEFDGRAFRFIRTVPDDGTFNTKAP